MLHPDQYPSGYRDSPAGPFRLQTLDSAFAKPRTTVFPNLKFTNQVNTIDIVKNSAYRSCRSEQPCEIYHEAYPITVRQNAERAGKLLMLPTFAELKITLRNSDAKVKCDADL